VYISNKSDELNTTWWWVRKLVTILSYSIAKHSHVMYRTRSSSRNKYKPHIEVTDSQYILRRISMSSHILKHLFACTTKGICVPSIAPMQLSKYGLKRASLCLRWTVLNSGSLGFIISTDKRYTKFNTSLNFRLTVSVDLSNQFSACLVDCGAPIIHKNIDMASI
jgi:hypothetical protein